MTEPSQSVLIAETTRASSTMHDLIATADRAGLRRRSTGTRWTNQQLLFHMLFGYLLIRRLRLLVLLLSRLPPPVQRGFATTLNAASRPFHVINYLGSAAGGTVLPPQTIAAWTDTTITAINRRITRETDADLDRAYLDLERFALKHKNSGGSPASSPVLGLPLRGGAGARHAPRPEVPRPRTSLTVCPAGSRCPFTNDPWFRAQLRF